MVIERLLNTGSDFIAQQVEHYTFNVGVVGSIPTGITKTRENSMKIFKAYRLVAFFTGADLYSNFYKSEINYEGLRFQCGESLFMFLKAKYFGDEDIAMEILKNSDNPRFCKELGRLVRNYNDGKWSSVRYDVMLFVVMMKLRSSKEIRDHYMKLIDEGYEFVEASPYDKIWGCGLAENDLRILDKSKWRGSNLLGTVYNNVHEILDNDSLRDLSDIFGYSKTF